MPNSPPSANCVDALCITVGAKRGHDQCLGLTAGEDRGHVLQDVRAKIEQSDNVDLAPLTAQLTDLQDQIEPLSSMPPQLATLSKQATSLAETQDSSLKSEIALLEQRLTALTDVMWQPMQKDLQSLSAKIPATSDVTRQVEDRLRAIEEGLPVLRSTTTGISAVIDANGIVRSYIPSGADGRLDGAIPPAKGATLFAKLGNILPLGWAFFLIGASLVALRLRRS